MNLHDKPPVQHPMLLNEIRNFNFNNKDKKNEILMGPNHPIFSSTFIQSQHTRTREYLQPRFDPIINTAIYSNLALRSGNPNFDHLPPPNFNFGDFI
jgi:hypothetical protein